MSCSVLMCHQIHVLIIKHAQKNIVNYLDGCQFVPSHATGVESLLYHSEV